MHLHTFAMQTYAFAYDRMRSNTSKSDSLLQIAIRYLEKRFAIVQTRADHTPAAHCVGTIREAFASLC